MVKKWNLLPEKCGYLAKIWFIWFKPACTAQSANPSSKTWFKRPDEQYIHGFRLILYNIIKNIIFRYQKLIFDLENGFRKLKFFNF